MQRRGWEAAQAPKGLGVAEGPRVNYPLSLCLKSEPVGRGWALWSQGIDFPCY